MCVPVEDRSGGNERGDLHETSVSDHQQPSGKNIVDGFTMGWTTTFRRDPPSPSECITPVQRTHRTSLRPAKTPEFDFPS